MYIRQLLIIKMRATLLTPDEIESMQMDEELFRVSTKESLVQKKKKKFSTKTCTCISISFMFSYD